MLELILWLLGIHTEQIVPLEARSCDNTHEIIEYYESFESDYIPIYEI